jgi:signal transduction histidine kinase/CheY-like chemotaxis protein
VLIWEWAVSLQQGARFAPLFALTVIACGLTFFVWRFKLLRFAFKTQPAVMADQPTFRSMTKLALVYGVVWVISCVYIYLYRAPLGQGFEVLLLTLQMGVLLYSLFHVDGQLKRMAWMLLFIQIACAVGVALASDQGHRFYLEVVATVVFFLVGYVVAAFRAREHAYARLDQKDRHEENGYLVQQVAHLQEAHAAKARLLAMVSHDLRQPVHALGLMLGRLRREASLSSLRVEVEAVNEVVNSLSKSLTMLMAVTRLNSGQIVTLPEAISLEKLFGSLANEFEGTATASGMSLIFESRELNVLTDPNHLRTIMTNLVSNAIKYSSRGVIRITALSPIPKTVVISVEDNGIGIPSDDLERIFEPFVRLPYRKGSVDGIGLGLAIVKQTADLIKAPIEVESVLGQGTTFLLTLPRSEDLEATVAPAKETFLRGVRIVVVDNDEIVLESMARTLEEWGCRVIAAGDWVGLEAKLEMTSSPIDLILTDFHLDAGLSGYELIKRVRKRLGARIPSILLTGDVEIRHGPESTATAVVIAYKPLSYEKLASLIQETISSFGSVESQGAS